MPNDGTILLVEDNPDDELLTLDALQNARLTNPVTVVRDGQAALDYLFGDPELPRLVLLDLKLPRVSGREVLRRLKTDERTKRVPIVVLTTSSEKSDIYECYGNGANSYVRKPVEFDKFLEAVRHLGLYWTLVNEPA